MFWLFGNFFGICWLDIWLVVLMIVLGLGIIFWYLCVFDVFMFGIESVVFIGVDVCCM